MCIGRGAWACHEWLADAFDGKLSGAVLHIFTVASGCLVPISAPKQAGKDPRFDPRIVAALSETGKLVP